MPPVKPPFGGNNSWIPPSSVYSGSGPRYWIQVKQGEVEISIGGDYSDDIFELYKKVVAFEHTKQMRGLAVAMSKG